MKSMVFTLILFTMFTASLAKAAPSHALFTNVQVFDGVSEELADYDVLVDGNLIKQVARVIDAPEGATVIDGGGRTLMPGLMDAHVHLALVRRPIYAAIFTVGLISICSFTIMHILPKSFEFDFEAVAVMAMTLSVLATLTAWLAVRYDIGYKG